jgi:hypothetical protein
MPVGEAWHTERGGMRIIMEKNSSNKFEISGVGKKRHIGKERMVAWYGTWSIGVCG